MKYIKLLLVFLGIYSPLFCQTVSTNNRKAIKYFEEANSYFSNHQFDLAIKELNNAVTEDSLFYEAHLLRGEIFRRLLNYQETKISFRKALQLKSSHESNLYFYTAEAELKTGEYSSADINLKKYTSLAQNLSTNRKQLVQKYADDIAYSFSALKKPVAFEPINLGSAINSNQDEYLPVINANETNIIFTRKQNNNEDFYESILRFGKWNKAEYLSYNINTDQFNEGAQCLSPDGKFLFFTGCNRPDGLGRCDLYVCKKNGNEWSKPLNLGEPVNSSTWESQPCISADGNTLFFTSNRPGGYGGYDIWQCSMLKDGNWTEPINLGKTINTPFDEESAYIHPDGKTLYFSSKGWPGLGGRDLFFSKLNIEGKWQNPINLGYPINTFKDEGGLVVSADGNFAYYSSDRAGGFGKMDIYRFELTKANKPEPVFIVDGNVIDAESKTPLSAIVTIYDLKNHKKQFENETLTDGNFLTTLPNGSRYSINVTLPEYAFYSQLISLDYDGNESKTKNVKIELKRIKSGVSTILNNIFFETNSYQLQTQSETELEQLSIYFLQNPKVQLQICGHTDNVGDEKQNITLSLNRAKSVYNYLLNKNINPARLTYQGFGSSRPIATNTTEEGKQKNRRTELVYK